MGRKEATDYSGNLASFPGSISQLLFARSKPLILLLGKKSWEVEPGNEASRNLGHPSNEDTSVLVTL